MPTRKPSREVIYDKFFVKTFRGEKALTAEQAKKFLGWEEEGKEKFENNFLVKDNDGKKIRCNNNQRNRWFTQSNCDALMQEILRGHWKFNCVNRIIGKTGLILSAQHTLIALVLAVQKWEKDPEKYPFWKTEPTMETTIAFGCDEDDETVDTIDTGRSRTYAEVIYRKDYFASLPPKDRKKASRVLDYAVKLAWDRTGVKNAFAIRRTHSESDDFVARHPKIIECARHIYEEDGSNKQVAFYISPGSAAGLLYLMACSTTEPKKYLQDENPREELLDWKHWDKACDFWVNLAGNSPETDCVRKALIKLTNEGRKNYASQCAIVIKTWNCYLTGEEITPKVLRLRYETDDHGYEQLIGCPTVGGIDVGDKEDIEIATRGDPTPEEIEERATEVRSTPPPEKKKPRRRFKGNTSKLVGKVLWVDDGVEPWRGKVVEVEGKNARLKCLSGFKGAGNVRPATVASLSKSQPKTPPNGGKPS